MSDVLSDVNMYLSEPDETVLTAALRNKDDIPILMDIVGDDTPLVSQAEHLQDAIPADPQVRPVVATKDATLPQGLAIKGPTTHVSQQIHMSTEKVAFSAAQQAVSQTTSDSAATPMSSAFDPVSVAPSVDADILAEVIQTVLKRKLPDIVQDVLQEMAKREQS